MNDNTENIILSSFTVYILLTVSMDQQKNTLINKIQYTFFDKLIINNII